MQAPLRFPKHVSEACRDLITKLLNREAKDRLGSRGSHEIKKHSWLSKVDWEAIVVKSVYVEMYPECKLRNKVESRLLDNIAMTDEEFEKWNFAVSYRDSQIGEVPDWSYMNEEI